MAAYLAYHRTAMHGGVVGDMYGNDPFVWAVPFVWSHCNARNRPKWFGVTPRPPFVHGRDAVFFAGHHPETGELVCDSVLVLQQRLDIAAAEALWPETHPIRHYHFDQDRNAGHASSTFTRVADPDLSFVVHPAMPLGEGIEAFVTEAKTTIASYFGQPRIKNARRLNNPQGLYDLILEWVAREGHQRLPRIPLRTLAKVQLEHPAPHPIEWDFP